MTKLKLFSGKVRQYFQNYLNQNLVIRSFLENGFEASLRSCSERWKKAFFSLLQLFE